MGIPYLYLDFVKLSAVLGWQIGLIVSLLNFVDVTVSSILILVPSALVILPIYFLSTTITKNLNVTAIAISVGYKLVLLLCISISVLVTPGVLVAFIPLHRVK